MNTIKLLRNLAKRFPKSLADHGDHVGLMTGRLKEDTHTVLLCLDFDEIVYEKILQMKDKPDLILTHHPFIYGTKYHVFKYCEFKRIVCEKIDALGIPVYSMHTNFDKGVGGMNDALAEALELQDIHPLETCYMARGGRLKEPMNIRDFAYYANKKLHMEYSHLVHGGKDTVETVAVLGGAGSYKYKNAMEEGYDIFITGDTPHHIRRDVLAQHYNYLDMPHEVEKIFVPQMKKILLSIDPSLKVIEVDHEALPELIQ